ncbi:unnamed protein product, partial [Ectocarpus sp. 12 AP-2014]
FELYLSGDRRKRDLFSLFYAEQRRLEVDTTGGSDGGSRCGSGNVGGGDSNSTGNGARGRGGARGNNEDRFSDLMVVIQNLARIAEDSETSGNDSALGDSEADHHHHHHQQMEGGGTAGRPRGSSREMSEALARA